MARITEAMLCDLLHAVGTRPQLGNKRASRPGLPCTCRRRFDPTAPNPPSPLTGLKLVKACILVPMATGMGLVLAFLTMRRRRPEAKYAARRVLRRQCCPTVPPLLPSRPLLNADPQPMHLRLPLPWPHRYIVWSRIDQKTCFKAIITAGFAPLIIELKRKGDALVTDTQAVEVRVVSICDVARAPRRLFELMRCAPARFPGCRRQSLPTVPAPFWPSSQQHRALPRARVTTSKPSPVSAARGRCVISRRLVPRLPPGRAHTNSLLQVPHIINNAYGLQASKLTHITNQAIRVGRVDAIVQSTDKVRRAAQGLVASRAGGPPLPFSRRRASAA